ncbi:hypothetical protein E2C01_083374 [Portunus trituberculatus]|uniref:Uncharacterized protein n=1 Tax=Portunus trituberculatus TaxID=210409 RepID=A0A5B7J1L0_PORTR|nr:hypothetical protein [Portunus trituberculatus]
MSNIEHSECGSRASPGLPCKVERVSYRSVGRSRPLVGRKMADINLVAKNERGCGMAPLEIAET